MKTSTRLIGAVSAAFVVSCAAGGVPGVRYIETFEAGYVFPEWISDDGSTIVARDFGNTPSIQIDRGSGWETIVSFQSSADIGWSDGASGDGSVVGFNNLYGSQAGLWRPDGSIDSVPIPNVGGGVADRLYVEGISSDGAVIGLSVSSGGEDYSVLLTQAASIEIDPGRSVLNPYYQSISAISGDGSRVTIEDEQEVSVGELTTAVRRAWVWDQGTLTRIPDLDLGDGPEWSSVQDISTDGTTAVGMSKAVFIGDNGRIDSGEQRAWVFRDGVTHEIHDDSLLYTRAIDVSADGFSVLVHGGTEDGPLGGFLWREGEGLVSLLDLFAQAGITEDLSGFVFNSMSDDATVFTGYESGFGDTVVVTIPSPGGVLALIGGLCMIPGRRRSRR